MGVPKFFRWVAERFPTVITPFKDMPPLVDNLYLDMNGIIHNCTHPNDVDAKQKTPTEKEIATAMFAYLEKLFNAIQPRKHFFLAVDGVAPRAKMNQQRQRRFRAAFDMAAAREEAIAMGEAVPDEADVFDSNCITPGTEFMVKMHEHFKYFLAMKIASDTAWQNCKIIFSGHDTPGEGEHKIVDFIRRRKMEPGYCPNETHCMYGLDADLVMLSLATHEPHFLLLREVVTFGTELSKREREEEAANAARGLVADPSFAKSDEFVLFHVNLLRDFLEMDVKRHFEGGQEPPGYDFESVVDDFVLMCFLIGNDFLPSLPTIGINDGSLPLMIELYTEHILAKGKPLTRNGKIEWDHLEVLIGFLGEREFDTIQQRQSEEQERQKYLGKVGGEAEALSSMLQVSTLQEYKERFYRTKHGFQHGYQRDSEEMQPLVQHYLEGLMWVWEYYFHGPSSWRWYYPHHYAPMASDMLNLKDVSQKIRFDENGPVLPHQQLLSVLPPQSYRLLPKAYWSLMRKERSPLAPYFPDELEIDREGTRAPWEGVVLIPFIDEKSLLAAYTSVQPYTTAEDKRNNTLRDATLLTYDAKMDPISFPSVLFSPLHGIRVRISPYQMPQSPVFVPRLCKGARVRNKMLEGFATLASKQQYLSPIYEVGTIKVFGPPTRRESMLLYFDPAKMPDFPTLEEARSLVGTEIMVGFPHYVRARVAYATDGHRMLRDPSPLTHSGGRLIEESVPLEGLADFDQTKIEQLRVLQCKLGLTMDDCPVLLYVHRFSGMGINEHGKLVREFSTNLTCYPLLLASRIQDLDLLPDERYVERARQPEDFEIGAPVMYVKKSKGKHEASKFVGSAGTLSKVTVKSNGNTPEGYTASLRVYSQPLILPHNVTEYANPKRWVSLGAIAHRVGVLPLTLSRIASSLISDQETGSVELGLCLSMPRSKLARVGYAKYCANNTRSQTAWTGHNMFARMENVKEVTGYHMNMDRAGAASPGGQNENEGGRWYYSELGVSLLVAYAQHFRPLLTYLDGRSSYQNVDIQLCLTDQWADRTVPSVVEDITNFLAETGVMELPMINASEDCYPRAVLTELEDFLIAKDPIPQPSIVFQSKTLSPFHFPVSRHKAFGQVVPLQPSCMKRQTFQLGSRVAYCCAQGSVKFGAKGTVVRLMGREAEVLYDQEFLGGTTMNGRLQTTRGAVNKLGNLLVLDDLLDTASTATKPGAHANAAKPAVATAPAAGRSNGAVPRPNVANQNKIPATAVLAAPQSRTTSPATASAPGPATAQVSRPAPTIAAADPPQTSVMSFFSNASPRTALPPAPVAYSAGSGVAILPSTNPAMVLNSTPYLPASNEVALAADHLTLPNGAHPSLVMPPAMTVPVAIPGGMMTSTPISQVCTTTTSVPSFSYIPVPMQYVPVPANPNPTTIIPSPSAASPPFKMRATAASFIPAASQASRGHANETSEVIINLLNKVEQKQMQQQRQKLAEGYASSPPPAEEPAAENNVLSFFLEKRRTPAPQPAVAASTSSSEVGHLWRNTGEDSSPATTTSTAAAIAIKGSEQGGIDVSVLADRLSTMSLSPVSVSMASRNSVFPPAFTGGKHLPVVRTPISPLGSNKRPTDARMPEKKTSNVLDMVLSARRATTAPAPTERTLVTISSHQPIIPGAQKSLLVPAVSQPPPAPPVSGAATTSGRTATTYTTESAAPLPVDITEAVDKLLQSQFDAFLSDLS